MVRYPGCTGIAGSRRCWNPGCHWSAGRYRIHGNDWNDWTYRIWIHGVDGTDWTYWTDWTDWTHRNDRTLGTGRTRICNLGVVEQHRTGPRSNRLPIVRTVYVCPDDADGQCGTCRCILWKRLHSEHRWITICKCECSHHLHCWNWILDFAAIPEYNYLDAARNVQCRTYRN